MHTSLFQLVPAFGITLPMVLWGIALGGIPIVIHLLHKRKYRETSWAAMRFLLEAARKNSRRVRLEKLLLLTVRTLLLLFLVGALQGMYFETTSTRLDQQGPTHHVVVIDASFSMRYRENAQADRFAEARKTALRIVDTLRPGDLVNLVLITGPSKRVVLSTPARSRQWIRSRFEQAAEEAEAKNDVDPNAAAGRVALSATHEFGRLLPTLTDVGQLLKRTELPRKKVYLISDFQAATWAPTSPTQRARIRNSLKSISENASLVLVDVSNGDAENAAITRLETESRFAVYGQPVRLKATAMNFGSQRLQNRTIEFYVDGRLADSRTVNLEPGKEQPIEFTYPPEKSPSAIPKLEIGEHYLEVRLDEDRLPLDNIRGLSLPVKDEIKVLLVDGNPGVTKRENAASYISKALRPSTEKEDWQGIIRPRTITEAALLGTDLSNVDCVFLCNVTSFQQSEARKLQAFVESGGGLVVCLGPQSRAENYNAVLFREGDGVLPARVRDHVQRYGAGDSFQLDTSTLIDTSKQVHPIVEVFRGNPGSGLQSVFCRRYFRADVPQGSPARVVLQFKDDDGENDPVLIASPVGQGRAALFTTSFDTSSSTWSLSFSFVPLINEVVNYVVAGRWNRRQYQVGEPIQRGFPVSPGRLPDTIGVRPPQGKQREVNLGDRNRWRTKREGADVFASPPASDGKNPPKKPTGRVPAKTQVRKLESRGGFSLVQWGSQSGWVDNTRLERIGYAGVYYTQTLRRGPYELLLRPPLGRREIYAVNVDPQESDLTAVGEKRLRADVLTGVGFDFRKGWRDRTVLNQTAGTQQSSLTRWLLIAVFCLIVVEQLMAWRFLAGLALLVALVAAEFGRQAYQHSARAGLVTTVILLCAAAGFALYLRRRRRFEERKRPTAF